MSATQNIGHYLNFYDSYQRAKSFSQKKGMIRLALTPLDSAVRLVSTYATDTLLLKPIKWGYGSLGKCATKGASLLFSEKTAKWVEDTWYDPIATKTVLKIGRWIESTTKNTATAKPVSWPLAAAIDKCRIALARHFYVVSKDLNSLLEIPDLLRDSIKWETIEPSKDEKVAAPKSSNRVWQALQAGTKFLSDALLALIAKVVALMGHPLEKIPYLDTLTEKAAQKIDEARNHIHKSVLEKAHSVIDAKETQLRRRLMEKVGDIVARTLVVETVNFSIKFALSKKTYELFSSAVTQLIDNKDLPDLMDSAASAGMKIAGFVLFVHMLLPTIERLHEDYKEEFDAEASTFKELRNLINRKNLPQIIGHIYRYFRPN